MRNQLTVLMWLGATALWAGSIAVPAIAHPGGLDAQGCHTNSRTGERHCHGKKGKVDLRKPAHPGDDGVLFGPAVRIIDGDTLKVRIQGAEMTFRLSGIDAPELDQPYGAESQKALTALVGSHQCVMRIVESDSYGRTVVHLWVEDVYVNAEMMKLGMAWFDPEYSQNESLYLLETEARDHKKGLWALPLDQRVEPWEWRNRRRTSRLSLVIAN